MSSTGNNLKRFMEAQSTVYEQALAEITNGKKRSHWMWYIFPQITGLGFSEISRFYAIKGLDEAKQFLEHPVLGVRLINICKELLKLKSNDAHDVFGSPDDIKLKSSMTLFGAVQGADLVFQLVLDKFFDGEMDDATLKIIK